MLKPSTFVPFISPAGLWSDHASPETLSVPLEGSLLERLWAVADELAVSEEAILLAAWRSLYARYTQDRDDQVLVVTQDHAADVAVDISGRPAPVAQVRLSAPLSAPFADVVRASEVALKASADAARGVAGREVAPGSGDLDSGPVLSFRYGKIHEELPAGRTPLTGSDVPGILHLDCSREPERLYLTLAGTFARVAKAELVLLAEAFEQLLGDALADGHRAVGVLRMQADQPLTPRPHRRHQSLLHRFLEQSETTPDRPAVRCGDKVLSYRELAQQSAAVGALLRERGVRAGDNVALLASASEDTVVAMLGTWMAEAAFVPFDPAWPAERVEAVLRQSGASLALVPDADTAVTLPVPTVSVAVAAASAAPSGSAAPSAEGAAYTIFTSGTSGTPKGVVIGHDQLAHYTSAILEQLRLPDDAEFATVSTPASDLSYTAIFPMLASGGCVRLVGLDDATSPQVLAERFRANPVSAMKLVPSHLSALLAESAEPLALLPGEVLVLGGEKLPQSLHDLLRELAPDLRVYNHYGPTETTIGASCLSLDALFDERCASLPVGFGLGENVLTVVDEENKPLPPWCPGEVLISGPGVGMGYLSELKEGRSGFGDRGASGHYHSGDLGRLVPGVGIEILGRLDDQVKLHGYRVQLGEIEGLLNQQPGVSACAVVPRTDDSGLVSHLDAYVVGDKNQTGAAPSIAGIQAALGRRLPAAMMPTGWEILAQLPLTRIGKVDRKALPPIEARSTTAGRPRDSVEQRLLALWAAVLDVEGLSPEDDFFENGGHSLRAIKLISVVNNAFGCKLPMSSIFSARTVASMATLIRNTDRRDSNLVPLRNTKSGKPVFCIHPGGGSTLSYWEMARLLPADVQVIGVESWGLHGRAPQESLVEMAEGYAAAISEASHEPPVLIGWCYGGAMAFETAQALRRAGVEVGKLILIDSSVPTAVEEENDEELQEAEPLTEATLISRFAWHYELELPEETSSAHTYDDVLMAMQKNGHLPPDAGADELRTLLDVYMANMAASEKHFEEQPELPTPDYPVTLIRAEPAELLLDEDRTWGWSSVVGPGLGFGSVDADHHSIMRAPAVSELARQIGQAFE
ncbi:AMP-binding protein [Streptomyces sp. DT203]|uniref:non-ribosomal peptide synthetase n=1 Tax=Streptomyces sp. DT203 TaxID=3393424 RepID=UPI003CEBBBFF